MTGQELRALRGGLPKPTPASEIARRLGYTRQWISYQEGRADVVDDDLATAYVKAVYQLRDEQFGREIVADDVLITEILPAVDGHDPGYEGGLAQARTWLRDNAGIRSVVLLGPGAHDRALVAVVDAFDRAGVDVSFRLDDGRRVLRSRRGS